MQCKPINANASLKSGLFEAFDLQRAVAGFNFHVERAEQAALDFDLGRVAVAHPAITVIVDLPDLAIGEFDPLIGFPAIKFTADVALNRIEFFNLLLFFQTKLLGCLTRQCSGGWGGLAGCGGWGGRCTGGGSEWQRIVTGQPGFAVGNGTATGQCVRFGGIGGTGGTDGTKREQLGQEQGEKKGQPGQGSVHGSFGRWVDKK